MFFLLCFNTDKTASFRCVDFFHDFCEINKADKHTDKQAVCPSNDEEKSGRMDGLTDRHV